MSPSSDDGAQTAHAPQTTCENHDVTGLEEQEVFEGEEEAERSLLSALERRENPSLTDVVLSAMPFAEDAATAPPNAQNRGRSMNGAPPQHPRPKTFRAEMHSSMTARRPPPSMHRKNASAESFSLAGLAAHSAREKRELGGGPTDGAGKGGSLQDSKSSVGRQRRPTLANIAFRVASMSKSQRALLGGEGNEGAARDKFLPTSFHNVPPAQHHGSNADITNNMEQLIWNDHDEGLFLIPERNKDDGENQTENNGDEEVGNGNIGGSYKLSETTPLKKTEIKPQYTRASTVPTTRRTSKQPPKRGVLRFFQLQNAALKQALHPRIVCAKIAFFLRTTFLFIMAPCLALAYALYYHMGNPTIQFLPLDATVSWWLVFIVRQLLVLHLVLCMQHVVVDTYAIHTPVTAQLWGPLYTLLMVQSRGWPFIFTFWGCFSLLLTHGDQAFTQNWLYWLDIGLLSDRNAGASILASNMYLRIFVSMTIAGVTTAVKRAYLTLYLGRRSVLHYKSSLEQLMVNVLILSEVAEMAEAAESPEFVEALSDLSVRKLEEESTKPSPRNELSKDPRWNDIKFQESKRRSDLSSDSDINFIYDDNGEGKVPSASTTENAERSPLPAAKDLERTSSTTLGIKWKLDRWEEPINKLDKPSDPSMHDVLLFQRALMYMDDSHPFSLAFGPSDTRDRCIKSSQRLYKRLLKFAPESENLPFDVIDALAYDEDGNYDEERGQAITRLFRPDAFNELSLLSFVQSCDWVYKKLRYFRASVSNSSLIDKVLCQIFNCFFGLGLAFVILAVLNLNPWALLVSSLSLIVSFAFALGPSVAKYIEGILLIAVRRPFDLGDRIAICPADSVANPGPADTWLVEDITLFTTTLRYAATNEVSTVNNGAIANARIINCGRSIKALVTLNLRFNYKATLEEMESFRSAVDQYIKNNPRTWANIVFFRTVDINPDFEFSEYLLRVQHVKPSQDIGRIMMDRGELLKFCVTVMEKLGTVYDSPGSTVNLRLPSPASDLVSTLKAPV